MAQGYDHAGLLDVYGHPAESATPCRNTRRAVRRSVKLT